MALLPASCTALLLFISILQAHYSLTEQVKIQEDVISVENEAKSCTNSNDSECVAATTECGVWMAISTIPDAGLGMFAGREFQTDEDLLETGDIVIPIVDFTLNQWKYRYKFLWDDYTWSAESLLMHDEGLNEVNGASPGFGSCANSYLDLQNVDEWRPYVDNAGLDRHKDPGAGASSAYHNRRSTATQTILPGQELFVSYGRDWFEHRARLGPIPLSGDHQRGQVLFEKFLRMQRRLVNATEPLWDMWERFIWQSPYKNESRILNALPASWDDMDYALNNGGILNMRKRKHQVTPQWLEENGRCMDNMKVAKSTLPQAGRGAFATRFLKKGTVVAPVPLIHLPHAERMEMHETKETIVNNVTKIGLKDRDTVTGFQLLKNYCYGNSKSTVLLCPYGVMTAAVNHNQTQANLKMQWGDPKRTGHSPEWFDLPIMSLIKEKRTGLVMELVATRDIQPGEELFLNYGNDWEQAWNKHVKNWNPPAKEPFADERTVDKLNADLEKNVKTVYELKNDPYPPGVKLRCELCFQRKAKWKKYMGNHTALMEFVAYQDEHQQDCDLLRRDTVNGTVLYTAVLIDDDDNGEESDRTEMVQVPIEAFVFVYKPYASDMHLPNAFRHSIGIPDDIFPEKWMNLVNKEE